jgi:dihydroneopterin aldolase
VTDLGTDMIRVMGIRGFGYHGVLDAERELGQLFVVDVALALSTHRAAVTDDLSHTVDYAKVAGDAHDRITGPAFALVETLADRIAGDCLRHPGVEVAQVTVHKPQAPVAVPFDDISVTVTRRPR